MIGRQSPARTAETGGAAGLGAQALDPAGGVPLYRQLLADLRRRILAGAFDGDGRLPSEAQIERSYRVSRITVRRALQELAQEGLIERRQGRPTRVARHRLQRPTEAGLEGELANMLSMGFQTESEVLEIGEMPAPPEVAARLDLPAAAPVHRLLRLRRMAGRPFCRSLAFLPLELAERVSRAALESEPLLLLLVRDGLILGRVEQTIAAVAATAELAAPLQVPEGAPLLLIERLFRDERGRPVELVYIHFRADRYRYGMSFRPSAAAEAQDDAVRPEPLTLLERAP